MPRKAKPLQSNNQNDDKPKKRKSKGKGDKKSDKQKKKAPQKRRRWKDYSSMLKTLSEDDLRLHLNVWLSSLFRGFRRE